MPTNLPPEYYAVEKRYKAAETVQEKIECLEEMLSTIPKHKGTDKLRADYRRRLSKLRDASQKGKGGSRQDSAFHVDKEGAGQVVVIGPPNVGKSALVDTLTNATPEVSPAPYTTWQPMPGMMPWEDIQVQLVDTPALSRNYVEPALIDLIRRADLMLLLVNLQRDPVTQLEDTVALLREHRIVPLQLEGEVEEDRRLVFLPMLVAVNKYDDGGFDEDYEIFCALLEGDWPLLPISVTGGRGLEGLKRAIVEELDIIRVYSKIPGRPPDFSAPFVMNAGSTVAEFAEQVHRDFFENLKAARVWGSAAFDGQMVSRDHVLQDKDVVELHL